MKHMILQEVLTSWHAAKRKSTLLVWSLVTEWTWNGRALKGKKPTCLEAIICYGMYWRIFSFGESPWFTHQKRLFRNTQKGVTKTPSYAIFTVAVMLWFTRCKNGRLLQGCSSNSKCPEEGIRLASWAQNLYVQQISVNGHCVQMPEKSPAGS